MGRAMAAVLRAYGAQATLVGGDLIAAHREADDAVTTTTGWWLMSALTVRARVAIAQGEPEQAERDGHAGALAIAAHIQTRSGVADALECLADLTGDGGSAREATRLFGAAHAIRQGIGEVRFKVYDAGHQASVTARRDTMGEKDFDSARTEGAALSTDQAIAYAQRGRGQRKRPTTGWVSLTPPNATSCASSATGWPTTTSPQGFSSHQAPCKPASPTSTANSASPAALFTTSRSLSMRLSLNLTEHQRRYQ